MNNENEPKKFDDTNKGVLFRNEDKKPEEKNLPDWTGHIFITPNLAGKKIQMCGFNRVSRNGKDFIPISVREYPPREDAESF